jgi:phosphoglycolate phosphatase-like HAD superfamily hydrolase
MPLAKNAYLFDIDGTLLHARGIGRQAFEIALQKVMGKPYSLQNEDFSGRTDRDILYGILEKEGIEKEEIENLLPSLYDVYIEVFEELVSENKDKLLVFPKVKELLDALRGECVGLLTGNLKESAYIKLKAAGLDGYFPYNVGAFGDISRNRVKLFRVALDSLKKYYGVDGFKKIWIIGDSHKDILCAKANNAISFAVATGKESKEELAKYNPDYLFCDFTEIDSIIKILSS